MAFHGAGPRTALAMQRTDLRTWLAGDLKVRLSVRLTEGKLLEMKRTPFPRLHR